MKGIFEVQTNGFGIFKKNQNAVTYGAFGCCGLVIQDKKTKDYLLAHIGQELILSKPLADKTVQTMLDAYKGSKYDIANANIIIIHDNKIQDIFPNVKPEDLDRTFSDAFKGNKFVMGIPCNEYLAEALKRKGLTPKIDGSQNGNIVEFLQKSYSGTLSQRQDDATEKTDIAIIDGTTHLQTQNTNVENRKSTELFSSIEDSGLYKKISPKQNEVFCTAKMVEGLSGNMPLGKKINPFDAVGIHIKTILKNTGKTLGTLDESDVKVLLQKEFQIYDVNQVDRLKERLGEIEVNMNNLKKTYEEIVGKVSQNKSQDTQKNADKKNADIKISTSAKIASQIANNQNSGSKYKGRGR